MNSARFVPKKKTAQIYINIPGYRTLWAEANPGCNAMMVPALEAAQKAYEQAYTKGARVLAPKKQAQGHNKGTIQRKR